MKAAASFLVLVTLALILSCGKAETPKVEAAASEAAPNSGPASMPVSAAGRAAAGIATTVASYQSVEGDEEAPGQLTWNEDRTWFVGTVAGGRVAEVNVRVGDPVGAGMVLARYHSHEVHDTRASLRQSQTELTRAKSQLDLSRRNLERMKRLLELKAVPQVHVDDAAADVRNSQAAVEKAQADIDRERQHLTDVLDLPETSQHAEHPPGEHGEDELIPVKAPANGVVVERKINPGSAVTAGEQVFRIADPDSLWALAAFPERLLPQLRAGQSVEVRAQAFPEILFHGRIVRLGETSDPQTRTLKVRVAVTSNGKLKPEMYVTVKLPSVARRFLAVPSGAVQEIDGKSTVFVESGGQFMPRVVDSEIQGQWAVIRQGLREGERVASSGAVFLKGKLVLKNEE